MITTYVFDLDGTLVASEDRERRAFALLAAAGAEMERVRTASRALWPEVCASRIHIDEKFRQEALAGGVSAAAAEQFVAVMNESVPAYADALPVLERLAGAGYRLAVITNGPPGDHQRAKLRSAGLDRFFGEFVFISCEVGVAKPDPRIFHHALNALGSRPEEALFVGDSLEHDAAGAVGAGLQGLWIHRHGSDRALPAGVRRITTLAEI